MEGEVNGRRREVGLEKRRGNKEETGKEKEGGKNKNEDVKSKSGNISCGEMRKG